MFQKNLAPLVQPIVKIAMIGAFMAALSGCSSMSSALGMEKSSPDEFAIITKAPLIIPPDFSLRPPAPGTQGPVQSDPAAVAADAVFKAGEGEGEAVNTGPTDGELTLLASAGADDADGSIRTIVEDEYATTGKPKKSVTQRMMFWRGDGQDAAPPKVVGRPSAKEEVPVEEPAPVEVKKKKKSLADRIFFWRKSDEEPEAKEEPAAEEETSDVEVTADAEAPTTD